MTGRTIQGVKGYQPTFDVWMLTYERLRHQYGQERAQRKMAGQDHESRLDELAWRCLGEGRPH